MISLEERQNEEGSERENFSNFVQYERLYGAQDDAIRAHPQLP
jgi:hypothetical protein